MKTLLVVLLLAASSALMAQPTASSFVKSIAMRQTEQLVKPLDLSKKQTNKILAINQDYARRNMLLAGQRRVLQSLGYMDATVEQTFVQALSNRFEARNQEIKAVLNDEQCVAFTTLLPDLRKELYAPMRFMHERARDRFES